jgi:hypothetical protein
MEYIVLIGTEDVTRAASAMRQAAEMMQGVASQIDYTMQQRMQWEEEYLQRIEAIVNRELEAYADSKDKS